jgi:hypothetical protein
MIGTVAANAHHSGKTTSAMTPNTAKHIQKIFRCML